MDLKLIRCEFVDWMNPAQDSGQWEALGNTIVNLLVP